MSFLYTRTRLNRPGWRAASLVAIVLLLAWAVPMVQAAPAGGTPGSTRGMAWELRSASTTVYLVGSIHVATSAMYPLPRPILDAFDASQVLAVEALPPSPGEAAGLVRRYGTYGPARSLKKAIPAELYSALLKRAAPLGLGAAQLDRMRPWMVANTLIFFQLARAGLTQGWGIDAFFMRRARKARKPIEQLESAEFQLALFARLAPPVQLAFLKETVTERSTVKQVGQMLTAWKNGDTRAMEDLVFHPALKKNKELQVFTDLIITRRNDTMARKVASYLSGKRVVFVVVGAGHVIGPRGILKQLPPGTRVRRL